MLSLVLLPPRAHPAATDSRYGTEVVTGVVFFEAVDFPAAEPLVVAL